MMRRRYFNHRAAYAPRMWPWMVPVLVFVGSVTWILNPGVWLAGAIGFGVSFAAGQAIWFIWRRRHPVLPVQERLDRWRQAAPWN